MTACVIISRCAKTQIKRNRKMKQCVISRIGKFIGHNGINTVTWRKAGTITAVFLIGDLRKQSDVKIHHQTHYFSKPSALPTCVDNTYTHLHICTSQSVRQKHMLSSVVTWSAGHLEKLQPLSHSKKPKYMYTQAAAYSKMRSFTSV